VKVLDILSMIAESKILKAIEQGELKSLPGEGRPLELEDLSHVPEELRAGYKILKNSGVIPEELQLKKEIVSMQKLIDYCYEDEEKKVLIKKLNEKVLRFNMLMEQRKGHSAALSLYKDKIYEKFGGY